MKRLAGDLPAFDSVWLDALVQTQRLTSFQAQAIDAHEADQLQLGPCVVLDRIGGCQSETFLTRDLSTQTLLVVKKLNVPAELKPGILTRLQELVEKCRRVGHPGVVLPHACSELGATSSPKRKAAGKDVHWAGTRVDLGVASRLVTGMSASDLLLRRGRFPADVVLELARQLLETLSVLHSNGIVHGELGLRNIRLTRHGQTVLVDAGILPAVQPELQLGTFARPDRYDGIAPELIGSGQTPSARTDLYALGTVLWHLLAGRPPYSTGDPFAKLASHQSCRIDDIRELAPETPKLLAELIEWLTEPDPHHRPRAARDALFATDVRRAGNAVHTTPDSDTGLTSMQSNVQLLSGNGRSVAASSPSQASQQTLTTGYPNRSSIGPPRRGGRAILTDFACSFEHPPVRRVPKPVSRFPQFVMASAVVVVFAALSVIGLQDRTRQWVLMELRRVGLATGKTQDLASTSETASTHMVVRKIEPSGDVEPLPRPDARGFIQLDGRATYRAEKLVWQGQTLTLRGNPQEPARIVVDAEPLWLRGNDVVLEHVEIQLNQGPGPQPNQLLVSESQRLKFVNCTFRSSANRSTSADRLNSTPGLAAVIWGPRDPNDPLPRQLVAERLRLLGDYGTIQVIGRDHHIELSNVLEAGGGPLVWLETRPGKKMARNRVSLSGSTLRDCTGVVALPVADDGRLHATLELELQDVLLALRQRADGQSTEPLVTFVGKQLVADWQEQVSVRSIDSVSRSGLIPFALAGRDGVQLSVLRTTGRAIAGLGSAQFTFRGQRLDSEQDSLLDEFLARRETATLPGIPSDEAN